MRDWEITLAFHYPHDRFALGWEYLRPNDEVKLYTLQIFLLIATLTFNLES